MRNVTVLNLLLVTLSMAGCNGYIDAKIFSSKTNIASPENSVITILPPSGSSDGSGSGGSGGASGSHLIADGRTIVEIEISLIDTSGQPMTGVTPTINMTGPDNNILGCTKSDASGKSICKVVTSTPGAHDITLVVNGDPVKTISATFLPGPRTSSFGDTVIAGDLGRGGSTNQYVMIAGVSALGGEVIYRDTSLQTRSVQSVQGLLNVSQ